MVEVGAPVIFIDSHDFDSKFLSSHSIMTVFYNSDFGMKGRRQEAVFYFKPDEISLRIDLEPLGEEYFAFVIHR